MIRAFARPIRLVLALAFCTFIPVMMAAVRVVQIPLGALPEDSLRLAFVPVAFFLHALAGMLFGLLGPLQFVRALRRQFGPLHRLSGRAFVLAGVGSALSGLALLLQVESMATGLLDAARGVFSLALIAVLVPGVAVARAHAMLRHRTWMIRAYAIGMGSGTPALVLFPVYLISGEPPTGLTTDIAVVGVWLLTIAVGEWVVRRLAFPKPLQPVSTVTRPDQRRGRCTNIGKVDSHRGSHDDGAARRGSVKSSDDLNDDLARLPARTGRCFALAADGRVLPDRL